MTVQIGRRGFLGGLLAVVAAPTIVRAASLMPIKVILPEPRMFVVTAINNGGFITLDDYAERILWPRIMEHEKRAILQIMASHSLNIGDIVTISGVNNVG